MYLDHINECIQHIECPSDPQILDLVLEGGGFNGSYEYGVLLVLRELEKKGYVKIRRISGTSIGSVLGFYYYTNTLESYMDSMKHMQRKFKEDGSLSYSQTLLRESIDTMSNETFDKLKDDKLFITYYDVTQRKQMVQSNYVTKEDLYSGIVKSCYIPFLLGDTMTYKTGQSNDYIDGGQPYIFKNRSHDDTKILYVSINQISKLKRMISLHKECDASGRILEGIIDAIQFFMYKKKTHLCSFVNEWNVFDFIYIRIKQIGMLFVTYILSFLIIIWNRVPNGFKDSVPYSFIVKIIQQFVHDIILLYCF